VKTHLVDTTAMAFSLYIHCDQ